MRRGIRWGDIPPGYFWEHFPPSYDEDPPDVDDDRPLPVFEPVERNADV